MAQLWLVGDDIDTDRIIPGKYTKTLELSVLKAHVFEDLKSLDSSLIQPGDILVAGENFGCGSSREQAAIAIKELQLDCIIAKSFARIFFRNGINVGLHLLTIPHHSINQASELEVTFSKGLVTDQKQDKIYHSDPLPSFLLAILAEGGLVPYLKKHRSYPDLEVAT